MLVSVVQQGADQVPPGRWWLSDLPGSSLCYRGGFSHWSVDHVSMCSPEVPGQMVGALSFQPIFGWSSQLVVEWMTRQCPLCLVCHFTYSVVKTHWSGICCFFPLPLARAKVGKLGYLLKHCHSSRLTLGLSNYLSIYPVVWLTVGAPL